MAIVILSIAMTGILSTLNYATRVSVDPVIQLQGIVFTENMLEQLHAQPYARLRSMDWDEIQAHYSNSDLISTMASSLFTLTIDITQTSLSPYVPDTQAKRVSVTCMHPRLGESPIELVTYRYQVPRQSSEAIEIEVPFNEG